VMNGNTTLGDAATDTVTVNALLQGVSPLIFEGATANTFNTTLAITDPTASQTITLPDASGVVALQGSAFTGNVTGDVTGNADTATTATALAANGTDCAAGSYPLGVDASGNAESCTVAGTGDFTDVNAGTGLSVSAGAAAGPSVTLALTSTGVTANSYTKADITVDAQGRITAAASGTESDPQVGTLTASNWCASNAGGTAIDCNKTVPAAAAHSHLDAEVADALTLSGGTINNSPIGATTASTGKFTTLETGTLKVTTGAGTAGRVLTSDVDGNATWQAAGGGGSGWGLTGNTGTTPGTDFIGTTDAANESVVFKVFGEQALKFTHSGNPGETPNLIGGHVGNKVAAGVFGATIGGGGASGVPNSVTGDFGTVSGGLVNTAYAGSTVAGGAGNTASGEYSTVAGGMSNTASNDSSTVAGGRSNTASGYASTVAGGQSNTAAGPYSFAAGLQAKIDTDHDGSFLFADSTGTDFNSAAMNEFAVRATGGVRFVSAPFLQLPNAGTPGTGKVLTSDASGNGTWQTPSGGSAPTYTIVNNPVSVSDGSTGAVHTITATCSSGKVTGGGVNIPDANALALNITPASSYPSSATAWTVTVIVFSTTATVTAYAICAS